MADGKRDEASRRGWLSEPLIQAALVTGAFTIIAAAIVAAPSFVDRRGDSRDGGDVSSVPEALSEPESRRVDLRGPSGDQTGEVPRQGEEPKGFLADSGPKEASTLVDREATRLQEETSYEPEIQRQSPVSATTARTLSHGGTTEIGALGVVLGADFKTTLGVRHVDVIFTAAGQPTRRLAAMAPGTEHDVEIGSRPFRLSVTAIDWQKRTVSMVLQQREGSE